ncbi:MAG: hypothetical protein CBB97_16690 [Candidatus Endolissoclinum sp. TMED37]|nr:MAG: hypothetical protein CBB97_16690 [Candidatus Endolissoclinum sp. TMED37]
MLFPIITFVTAIAIAGIAAWFSIVGLMAIFAASALPVALMAGSLEVGKLVAASWVYRNWKRAPLLLKTYLTIAVVVLMFITSMGIFGFLSKAHLEQAAEGEATTAKIERITDDIARFEIVIERTENKIAKLENETSNDSTDINVQIDAEQQRMDNAYARIQPAIDEQLEIIKQEQDGSEEQVKSYTAQINRIDDGLAKLQTYADNVEDSNNVKKIQAMVGTKVDGRYGYRTANAVEEYIDTQITEKNKLISIIEDIRKSANTDVIDEAREEIKRLRAMADREIQNAQDNINRLRGQLSRLDDVDNTDEITILVDKVRVSEQEVEVLIDEKFELESKNRELEAEVGPIKYIAELIYGETNPSIIDDAVRWLIIVFIFVFDPLAVILLVAANYSYFNRNNGDRQEEMFDGLFHRNEEKPLDKEEEISDNKDINVDSDKEEKVEDELKESEDKTYENEVKIELTDEETQQQLNELKTDFDKMMSTKESDEVVKDEIEEKEQEPEIIKETKEEMKTTESEPSVTLDPAEIDLEKVIEQADEQTLNKIKKDVEREINTKQEKKSGWLDDLGSGFYKD